MKVLKRKALTLKSWLPERVPMDLQYDLALTAKKLVGIKSNQHITVEFRSGSGNPLGQANWAWCKTHMQGPHSLETLIHELCHIKDFFTGKPFRDWNKRWGNRVHERRAVRDTKRIMEGELSERRSEYRERCRELMASISKLLDEKPEKSKPKGLVTQVDMRFKGEAAEDFGHYVIDLNVENEYDCDPDPERFGFGKWAEKHWDGSRFLCEIEGNEEMLKYLAGEMCYYSDFQPSFTRRSDHIADVVSKYEASKPKPTVDFTFGGSSAGDFHCILLDVNLESKEEKWREFGEWLQEHWNGKRFRCVVEGNEKHLAMLAQELYMNSHYQTSWERRSEKLKDMLRECQKSA